MTGILVERVQSADWDLYYTLRKRENEVGDVRRCVIVGGSYVHHFMRATLKSKPEPYACAHQKLSVDEKWSREEQAGLWFKPQDFLNPLSAHSRKQVVLRRFNRIGEKLSREVDRAFAWRWLLVRSDRILKVYTSRFMSVE